MGKLPARDQELCDYYMASLTTHTPALECMKEIEHECFKMGIPLKIRHQEVAPCQFEFAPEYGINTALRRHQRLGEGQQLVLLHRGHHVLRHQRSPDALEHGRHVCPANPPSQAHADTATLPMSYAVSTALTPPNTSGTPALPNPPPGAPPPTPPPRILRRWRGPDALKHGRRVRHVRQAPPPQAQRHVFCRCRPRLTSE